VCLRLIPSPASRRRVSARGSRRRVPPPDPSAPPLCIVCQKLSSEARVNSAHQTLACRRDSPAPESMR